jgi:exoribonuclease-2
MSLPKLAVNALVLYKTRPARVTALSDKVEIELEGGKSKRVRDKDVQLLHPGPLPGLKGLAEQEVDIREAWELLDGEATSFADLLGLVFDEATPSEAWSLWRTLADGLLFSGDPAALQPKTASEVAEEGSRRAAKAAEEAAWNSFLARLEARTILEEDRSRLLEVEKVCHGDFQTSHILSTLGIEASPENAWRFLVDVGYWPVDYNPHPGRLGVGLDSPALPLGSLPEEARLDLTRLDAWAIDDEGSQDPDDAISLDAGLVWVHIADVAALVAAEGELELEARSRGSNLYLPEGVSFMLPPELTDRLALGFTEESPALSVGFRLSADGVPEDIQIVQSRIRAKRLSYAEANRLLDAEPFASLHALAERYRVRRLAAGAVTLELPEVSVRLREGRPEIKAYEPLASREMVSNLMLMAGEAIAIHARSQGLPLAYAIQPPPEELREPKTLAEMYGYRRFFKPSRSSVEPGSHAGLGLEGYTRATSPLRRYQDLLVHQQVRALLHGHEPLTTDELGLRLALADEGAGRRRRLERLSNLHWKLVWLMQHQDWRGLGVVVDMDERKTTLLIPELAMETRIRTREGLKLDDELRLKTREVNLAEQNAYFRIL